MRSARPGSMVAGAGRSERCLPAWTLVRSWIGTDRRGGLNASMARLGDDSNVLNGGAGTDNLSGGNGIDTASYATSTTAVVANLTAPASNTGDAADETYSGIENLIG